jgi:hypothetical protein
MIKRTIARRVSMLAAFALVPKRGLKSSRHHAFGRFRVTSIRNCATQSPPSIGFKAARTLATPASSGAGLRPAFERDPAGMMIPALLD